MILAVGTPGALAATLGGQWFSLVIEVAIAMALVAVVVADTQARGRSAWRWVAGMVLLAPVTGPWWLALAVSDRLRQRPGIEGGCPSAQRPAVLGAAVLAVAAGVLALTPVQVADVSVSGSGYSASFDGGCGPVLAVALGGGAYGDRAGRPGPSEPAPVTAAWERVTAACDQAGGRRLTLSAVLLGGAVLMLLGAARRVDRRPAAGS